jgi:hypothetical protein
MAIQIQTEMMAESEAERDKGIMISRKVAFAPTWKLSTGGYKESAMMETRHDWLQPALEGYD